MTGGTKRVPTSFRQSTSGRIELLSRLMRLPPAKLVDARRFCGAGRGKGERAVRGCVRGGVPDDIKGSIGFGPGARPPRRRQPVDSTSGNLRWDAPTHHQVHAMVIVRPARSRHSWVSARGRRLARKIWASSHAPAARKPAQLQMWGPLPVRDDWGRRRETERLGAAKMYTSGTY